MDLNASGDLQSLDQIIIKASGEDHEDKEFTLSKDNLSFDQVLNILFEIYGNNVMSDEKQARDFTIKYRDEDLDLVTIATDRDLMEALRFCATKRQKGNPSCLMHLFLVSDKTDASSKNKLELHGILNLFSKFSIKDEEEPKKKNGDSSLLLKGSEWNGACIYDDDTYHFKLTVLERTVKDDKITIEGVIEWPSPLAARTKFLGNLVNQEFKFIEYEAITGADNVVVPSNYKGTIDTRTNKITEKVKASKQPEAKFELEFVGISSKKNGFFSLARDSEREPNPKRKYNLVNNDSYGRKTFEDQRMAFKRLVHGTEFWYDREKKGELEPRPKNEVEKTGYRQSCPNCGQPMFDQKTAVPGKTVLACNSYPYCQPKRHYYYDEDYYSSDDC